MDSGLTTPLIPLSEVAAPFLNIVEFYRYWLVNAAHHRFQVTIFELAMLVQRQPPSLKHK